MPLLVATRLEYRCGERAPPRPSSACFPATGLGQAGACNDAPSVLQGCISDGQSVILIREPDAPNTLKMKELNEKQFECIAIIDPATGKIDGEKPDTPPKPAFTTARKTRTGYACESNVNCMRRVEADDAAAPTGCDDNDAFLFVPTETKEARGCMQCLMLLKHSL